MCGEYFQYVTLYGAIRNERADSMTGHIATASKHGYVGCSIVAIPETTETNNYFRPRNEERKVAAGSR